MVVTTATGPATLRGVIVGILSDTHDRADAMALAVQILRRYNAEFLIHCGDIGSPQPMLDYLVGPSAFVFGNTDWDRQGLKRYAAQVQVNCLGNAGELELGAKMFHVEHGDDQRSMKKAIEEQRFDYLLHGHTHVKRDERFGRTRIINPGALHRAREKTVALLDTEKDHLLFLTVAR
jgi:uncharacterized protein